MYNQQRAENAALRFRSSRGDRDWKIVEEEFQSQFEYAARTFFLPGYEQEDIIQQLWLGLLVAIDSWKPNLSRLKTHVWRVNHNGMIELMDLKRIRDQRANETVWPENGEGDSFDPIDNRNSKEWFELTYDVERLPMTDRQKELIRGLSAGYQKQEIAAEMQLSSSCISWEVKALKENEAFCEWIGSR